MKGFLACALFSFAFAGLALFAELHNLDGFAVFSGLLAAVFAVYAGFAAKV
jgi:hypothetical protein